MSRASAPGKIILFGEHAVVYGRPALAVPVMQVHADVDVADGSRPGVWIHAPDVDLHAELSSLPSDHPLGAAARLFFSRFGVSPPPLEIHSLELSNEQINSLAYDIEKLHHGAPSGIDNTVVTYAKPVYFVRGQPIETFKVGAPFTLVIADTGVAAPTRESVGDVRRLWEADRPRWEKVFDAVGEIVRTAKEKIENGEWRALGALMDSNHSLLQRLTVSSPELDRLVEAAREAGALGAKLSGGGRGGNMIALVEKADAPTAAEALKFAGAKRTIVTEVV